MLRPLIVLVVSFLVGLAIAWRRRGPKRASADLTVEDLEERESHLIAQLKDLEEQKVRLDPTDYAQQKDEFETRAVETLRAIEKTPKGAEVTPAVGFFATRPQLRGALWGGGIVLFGAVLYGLVTTESHDAPAPPPMASQQDTEAQELYNRIMQKPDDVDALVRLAHKMLRQMMLEEARVLNDRVLQLDPKNTEGLVHAAVLRAGAGDQAGALSDLDGILKTQPKFAEAWFFRGMMGMQSGNQALMQESFKKFLEVAPEGPQRERVRAMLDNAR